MVCTIQNFKYLENTHFPLLRLNGKVVTSVLKKAGTFHNYFASRMPIVKQFAKIEIYYRKKCCYLLY